MSKDIVFWRGGGEARLTLIRALQGEGYEVHQLVKYEEVLDFVNKKNPLLCVIDASGGEREIQKRIAELGPAQGLYDFPVLFIGSGAVAKTADNLASKFERFKAIDVPFKIADVFAALKEVTVGEHKPHRIGSDSQASSPPSTLGGRKLVHARTLADFDDATLIPPHPKREVIEKSLARITETNEWLGLHARRTALGSSLIAHRLAFGPERETNVQTVSLLLNWGLLEENPLLAKKDLFMNVSDDVIKSVTQGFERSANFITQRLDDPIAARTALSVAKILSGEKSNENKEVLLDAQCALITELSNRACWGEGYWNSRGAYRVLSNLRPGGRFSLDKHIADLMSRILSEAVSSRVTLNDLTLPSLADHSQKAIRDVERREAQKEAERLFGVSDHEQVTLPELMAGMILARPVLTRDGQVILRANIELDKDLISRLWRLAAIVPLEPRLTIARDFPMKQVKRR